MFLKFKELDVATTTCMYVFNNLPQYSHHS